MLKLYEVTIRPRYPAYGYPETVLEIEAVSHAKAISRARKLNFHHEYHDSRAEGKITYKAKKIG